MMLCRVLGGLVLDPEIVQILIFHARCTSMDMLGLPDSFNDLHHRREQVLLASVHWMLSLDARLSLCQDAFDKVNRPLRSIKYSGIGRFNVRGDCDAVLLAQTGDKCLIEVEPELINLFVQQVKDRL